MTLTTDSPLNLNDSTYIERPFVNLIVRSLQSATHPYVNIRGGRQTGKTSAAYRVIDRLLADRHVCAYVDFAQISEQRSDSTVWLARMAGAIQASLMPLALRDQMPAPPESIEQYPQYLYALVDRLETIARFFLILDNITLVPDHLLVLFHKIREMHNARTQPGAAQQAQRVQFVFVGSFDPATFIRANTNSPVNIAIDYDTSEHDLSSTQVQIQAQHIGQEANAAAIFQRTSGHPYLTNALLNAIDLYGDVDRATQSLLGDAHFGVLRRLVGNNEERLEMLQAIQRGERVPYTRGVTDELTFLMVNGFLKAVHGRAVIRCDLYTIWLDLLEQRRNLHRAPARLTQIPAIAHPATREHLERLLSLAPEMINLYPVLAPVCMGVVLEAVLLEKLKAIPDTTPLVDQFNDEVSRMTHLQGISRIDKKSGAYKPISTWKLSQMIEIARIAGLIDLSAAQIAHAIRDWRNLIHPEKYATEYPDGFDDDAAQAALHAGRMLLKKLQR